MPQFNIYLEVEESEGVRQITPAEGRTWGIKFQCTSCRDVSPHFIDVDPSEDRDSGGGGTRNCVVKCQFCGAVITADVITEGTKPLVLGDDEAADAADNGRILVLDVRNGVPEELLFDAQWVVESEGGKTFADADLGDDWVEYDEDNGTSLSIMGVSIRVEKPKKSK